MNNKKGFTLVELLVAAAIISVLMVFATIQYRNSAAETRWTQAKAKAEQLANAVQRAKIDYDNLSFAITAMQDSGDGQCNLLTGSSSSPSELIDCEYIEKSSWDSDDYFEYHVCLNSSTSNDCPVAGALACVVPICGSKLPNDYKNIYYCVSVDSTAEVTADSGRCPTES